MPGPKKLLIIFLSLCFKFTTAQGPSIQTYTIQDGLVENYIRKIYQDKRGFIWIGTWEGLSRYDGHRFTNFSTTNGLSNDLVNDIMEYEDQMFIALNDGSVDIIKNNVAIRYQKFPFAINKFTKLPNGKIINPTDENGFYEFNKGKYIKPPQQNPKLNAQFVVPFNDSMLLSVNEGMSELTLLTNNYKQVSTAAVAKITLKIYEIYKDSYNRIWLCTETGLWLITYNSLSNTISLNHPSTAVIAKEMVNIPTYSILESDDGGYWIGNQNGLTRLISSEDYAKFSENDGFPNSKITTLFSDREKNIWVGTSKGLIKIVARNKIHNRTSLLTLTSGSLLSVTKLKDGKLLLNINNTTRHPILFNTDTKKMENISDQRSSNPLIYFPESDPLLFYNKDGFYGYNNTHKKIYPLLKRDVSQNFLYVGSGTSDGLGNCFFGLSNEIGVFSGKKLLIKTLTPDIRITTMKLIKPGSLWIGTWSKGLLRIDYTLTNDSFDFKIRNFSQFISDSSIRSLHIDTKNNIWVGTRNKGLFKLMPDLNDNYKIATFDKNSGLSSNYISAIAESENGDIWLGSRFGLDKMIKTTSGYRVFNFSKINYFIGLVSDIAPVGKNEWWCIINNNLVQFTDDFLDQTKAISPVITNIRLSNTNEQKIIFNPDTTISLPFSKNKVQFEFSAPGYINEKQIQYSFRLIGGNDSTWSDPSNIHEVSYASLQPGKYKFEVRTLGWNNQYSMPAIFSFNVLSPFWQTWWFYTLCIILIIAFFYALYLYRLKQILKVQTVRNRIATDLHDDIGSNLTNIGILAELTNKNLTNQTEAAKYLNRIAEEINDSGQALDDIIWNINSKNDTLNEMIIRMRRYAAELFDHTSTICSLTLMPGIENIKIGMEQRRDIYLVYKESLNNIYKHAAAKNVEIELNYVGQQINLLIRDDGIGFNTNRESHRNGIKNLKKRVEKWNGSIVIKSGKEEGTSIHLEMPLS